MINPIKNLFLVDDDDIYLFVTKRIIEQTQLAENIRIFTNGKEALDFLQEAAGNADLLPEMILLDLSMPVLDGWGFLEEYILLKPRLGKRITIYVVSSSVSPKDVERAKDISIVSDYIIKPVSRDHFVRMIKNL